jgi:hypothetical protein
MTPPDFDALDWQRILDERLELFFGLLTPVSGRVYARLRLEQPIPRVSLRGTMHGPQCTRAECLPARFSLRDMGPGPWLLAEALVTEPCSWTPALPHLYRVSVEVVREGRSVAAAERLMGLRPLGSDGRSLRLDFRRWVPRGVRQEAIGATPLDDWRQSATVPLVIQPSDAQCDEASRQGLLLAARIAVPAAEVPAEVRRLARWPAVALALIEAAPPDNREMRLAAANLILVAPWHGPERPPAPWAEAVLVTWTGKANELLPSLPRLYTRPEATYSGLAEARAACDALQAEIAAAGVTTAAGFFV